jgi:hypothetical protein
MLIYVWCTIGLAALVKGHLVVRRRRQRRAAGRDPWSYLFQTRELRELDEHLDRIAEVELRRIEARVSQYVAGLAGHVVDISKSHHGIVLGLSDGHRLGLDGVSGSTLRALKRRAANDRLRPARVERDSLSYRLLLRGEVGGDIELTLRRLVLSP